MDVYLRHIDSAEYRGRVLADDVPVQYLPALVQHLGSCGILWGEELYRDATGQFLTDDVTGEVVFEVICGRFES